HGRGPRRRDGGAQIHARRAHVGLIERAADAGKPDGHDHTNQDDHDEQFDGGEAEPTHADPSSRSSLVHVACLTASHLTTIDCTLGRGSTGTAKCCTSARRCTTPGGSGRSCRTAYAG